MRDNRTETNSSECRTERDPTKEECEDEDDAIEDRAEWPDPNQEYSPNQEQYPLDASRGIRKHKRRCNPRRDARNDLEATRTRCRRQENRPRGERNEQSAHGTTSSPKNRRRSGEEDHASDYLHNARGVYGQIGWTEDGADSREEEAQGRILAHVRPGNSVHLRSRSDVVCAGRLLGVWSETPRQTIHGTELWIDVDGRRPVRLQCFRCNCISNEVAPDNGRTFHKIGWFVG